MPPFLYWPLNIFIRRARENIWPINKNIWGKDLSFKDKEKESEDKK